MEQDQTSEEGMQFTAEQQAFIDKRIGQARIKSREKATSDATTAQSAAAQEAEQLKLETDKNWEKLVAMQKARVTELEPFETQVKAYEVLIETMLEDRIKILGDAAKKAVEALPETLTAIDKLNWLNTNQGLFTAEGPVSPVGTPAKKVKKQAAGKTRADLGHKRLRL